VLKHFVALVGQSYKTKLCVYFIGRLLYHFLFIMSDLSLSFCFGVISFSYGVYLEHFSCSMVKEDGVRSHTCLHLLDFFSLLILSQIKDMFNFCLKFPFPK